MTSNVKLLLAAKVAATCCMRMVCNASVVRVNIGGVLGCAQRCVGTQMIGACLRWA